MFHVSRKVGRNYGIIGTNDNVEEFYSMQYEGHRVFM